MNDLETAFPLDTRHGYYLGMSLRDYFAGQVIAGAHDTQKSDSELAKYAYEQADAMLAARGDQS